jgi:hypothetical protein
VGFDREFHKLSRNIKFINFGSVDISIFNFELGISIEFELNRIKLNSNGGLRRETLTGQREKEEQAGPAMRLARTGHLIVGSTCQRLLKHRNGTRSMDRWIRTGSDGARASSSPMRSYPGRGEPRGRRLTGAPARVGVGGVQRGR